MSRLKQIASYKSHLQNRYTKLVEKSNSYRFIDEVESDRAAFKAMKIRTKINRIHYLDRANL